MLRPVRLIGVGIVIGVATDRLVRELRKPSAEQFPGLRAGMNERVNPWLMEHGIPGSEGAEIGSLEHVGRVTGIARLTPVHPTLRDDTVLVPAPMGVGSQWAMNVLHAGRARLQLRDRLYDLDAPELITVSETRMFPAALAAPFDRLGCRYVRFHVAAARPGSFATPDGPAAAGVPASDESSAGPLDMPTEIPVEPRMASPVATPA